MIETEIIIKVVLAVISGGLIGFERQSAKKNAGLRTHILLSLASCVLVVASMEVSPIELTRVISGIVTGMGFIGAGAIISGENKIRGITTAASLWTVTIIGIVIALGIYDLAILVTLIALVVLWLGKIEYKTKIKKRKK